MDPVALERIESRIADLERRIKSDSSEDERSVIEKLLGVSKKIDEAVREDSLKVLGQTEVLETLLDPSLQFSIGVDNTTKLALIEAKLPVLEEAKSKLEAIESLNFVLESAHIKTVPTYSGKICGLEEKQSEQLDQIEGLTKQTTTLFEAYMRLMADLNQKFAVWDERIGKAEELMAERKKQAKK